MQADRHLLLGLLALQCGLISDDQLIAAFRAWTGDKQRSIEAILLEQKALSTSRIAVLRQLEQELLAQHGQNAEQSLATLSRMGSVRQQLEELSDAELSATLSRLPANWNEASVHRATNRGSKSVDGAKLRYQTIRLHAKGGIGEVYVAKDGELNREVALKEIQEQFADDEESRARFKLEAEITGNLEHPGIVPVYGLGQYQDGRPFYAMRFIRGDSLKEAIDAFHTKYKSQLVEGKAGLELRKLLRRFVDVCNAVAYAHSRGVLHRDLKPGNIILGKYGETLVVDWGLARAQGQSELTDASIGPIVPSSGSGVTPTLIGSAVGTPAYMSPEQAAGEIDELGPATDVYALGATLFHLLTGQLPITGKTLLEIVQKAEKGDLRKPRALRSDLPKSLEAVCIKAMAKEPSHRYPSPVQFAEDIEKWLADEPVSAYAEPISLRVRRWIKRHPAIVSTSAAVILLSLTGVLLFAFIQGAHAKELERKNKTISDQVVEVTQQKQKEEKERSRAEAREQDAIAAVKRFSDAVANNPELKNNPKLESLRKELLKEPIGYFRSLKDRLQGDQSTSIASLSRLAVATYGLALLTDQIGNKQDALVAYEQAKTTLELLARKNPASAENSSDLASTHHNIGLLLYEFSKFAEAQVAYNEAKRIRERLVREHPGVATYARDLLATHNNLGALHNEAANYTEALAEYAEAKEISERLAQEFPVDSKYAIELARNQHNLGVLLHLVGKPTEALAAYDEATKIRDRLRRENPTIAEYASDLALTHNNLGILQKQIGKLAEARESHEKAIRIQELLGREHPTVTEYMSALAASHHNLGLLLSEAGNLAESFAAYEEAKRIQERLARENPAVTKYTKELATSYLNIGQLFSKTGKPAEALAAYEEARKIQERMARENPNLADFASELAVCYSNIGLLLSMTGKSDEALAAYGEAKKIRERLARENPSNAQYTSALALSHNHDGSLLRKSGQPAQALVAYEEAKKIQEGLVRENPAVIEFASALAKTHHDLGTLLSEIGKPVEALAAYGEARKILARLVRDNPSVNKYASALAQSHNDLGGLLADAGKFDDALAFYEEAKRIQEKLTRDNPTVTEYGNGLARIYRHSGLDFNLAGKPVEALAAFEEAKKIQERLVRENPTVTDFSYALALSHNSIGNLLHQTGKPDQALGAYEQAKTLFERLALKNPAVAEFESSLGGTLNNLAVLHLEAKRFAEARILLVDAVQHQKRALEAYPQHRIYREFLVNHFTKLLETAAGLGDPKLAEEAQRGLVDLAENDPQDAELDARLSRVLAGESAKDASELLAFGQRMYELRRFAQAASFYRQALQLEASLAESRVSQILYNAACSAALAAAGEGAQNPPLDQAAKATLRSQALTWLKQELTQWHKFLGKDPKPEAKQTVVQTLAHWQKDSDLSSLRDPEKLTALPESERKEWEKLWHEVKALQDKVAELAIIPR